MGPCLTSFQKTIFVTKILAQHTFVREVGLRHFWEVLHRFVREVSLHHFWEVNTVLYAHAKSVCVIFGRFCIILYAKLVWGDF